MSSLVKAEYGFLNFSNIEEAKKAALDISKSGLVPKHYAKNHLDIVVCWQHGRELGLSPMQALSGIAVIRGKPCVYGDAMLALVRKHPDCEEIHETFENGVAKCEVKRKGQRPVVREFSEADAAQAKLLNSTPVWQSYKKRMLQMRARAFALRDSFADALMGFQMVEEVNDYRDDPVTVVSSRPVNSREPATRALVVRSEPVNDQPEKVTQEENSPSDPTPTGVSERDTPGGVSNDVPGEDTTETDFEGDDVTDYLPLIAWTKKLESAENAEDVYECQRLRDLLSPEDQVIANKAAKAHSLVREVLLRGANDSRGKS